MTSKREDGTLPSVRPATRFVTGGRDPFAQHGYVNPPVYHASTLLYRSAEDYLAHRSRYQYGRRGTPTSEALSDAIAELEGPACAGVALLPSGLAACSVALMAMLKAGDHILVTDNVYQPTRIFCDGNLSRQGVSTTYYDPLIGSGIASLFKPNTRAIYLESPGSLSFEVQDVPAIAAAAHAHGAVVLMDNTWASPLYFGRGKGVTSRSIRQQIYRRPPDLMLGTISANRVTGRSSRPFMRWACAWTRRHVSRTARTAHHRVRLAHYVAGLRRGLARSAAGSAARASSGARALCWARHLAARLYARRQRVFSVVFVSLKPQARRLRLRSPAAVRHGAAAGRLTRA
jgi:hypothetical protein